MAAARHWPILGTVREQVLAEVKAIRSAFEESQDKEALAVRWASLLHELGDFWVWEEGLRTDHGDKLRILQFAALSGGVAQARGAAPPPAAQSRRLVARIRGAENMKSRAERILSGLIDEELAFKSMQAAFDREKASRRLLGRLAGGAFVVLGAACLIYKLTYRTRRAQAPRAAPRVLPIIVGGNFELLRPLGRGSMGEVFEGMDKTLGRRVAMKRLRPELLQDPQELERLLNEARVMAGLKHPNMVAIYGVERDAGQIYLALEFVDGGTLEDRLQRERRLSWEEALRILEGAGSAVDYAHSRRVVHRDLKPSNIMLSSKGEVKVMDFSIAYQAAHSVSRMTRAPSWGTPPYMAPEQELGGVSQAVDIYALAVCLYEMLTGELPFKGPNFLAQKREALWASPSGLAPGLPQGSDGLFTIALAPEPSRRFASASALLAACRVLS